MEVCPKSGNPELKQSFLGVDCEDFRIHDFVNSDSVELEGRNLKLLNHYSEVSRIINLDLNNVLC